MKLAVITDSTCDLPKTELDRRDIRAVPLYVNFRGKVHRDWIEITPTDIIAGVTAGADLPSTSQPSPQDFEEAYREAVADGADAILCITISAELSGTFQSANLARESVDVPVTVFDSRGTSLGLGEMAMKAAAMRDAGAPLEAIMKAIEHIRDTNFVLFTVATLEFLQKGGRIGRAGALVGSLLNIKPILALVDGRIEPLGRARGTKKALREMIDQVRSYREKHPGDIVVNFVHIQDPSTADTLRAALTEAGIDYQDRGTYEMGAVIATHVGPGTFGMYLHTDPDSVGG